MLNPHNANEHLGSRLLDILLKTRSAGILTDAELADLAFGCGLSPVWQQLQTVRHYQQQLEDAQCQAASDRAELESVQRIGRGLPKLPRFADTGCSQCGGSFGPGDYGYSHCKDHGGKRY
jgi:hypothetical protein